MFSTTKKSQAGFSLVELMVVVAIIGVLASIAVPSVNKYLAKARQTEAKTNLSAIYTSEKAFYAEYTAYHSAFQAIGFAPEGKIRYNVGFGSAGDVADAANGYKQDPSLNAAWINSKVFCIPGGGTPTPGQPCSTLNGVDGKAPPDLSGFSVNSEESSFTAGAVAVIHSAVPVGDLWSIDENKELKNDRDGIR